MRLVLLLQYQKHNCRQVQYRYHRGIVLDGDPELCAVCTALLQYETHNSGIIYWDPEFWIPVQNLGARFWIPVHKSRIMCLVL